MSYQVIARKWRPQSFEEMVGQETVTRTLQNALTSGRIAHAFLFSGVRGVGKTTAARILSMALNCHQGITPSPCGECPSCIEIREGNAVDVHEIDAASNRGIDSIRELREAVRYGTARDRFKIHIVDEVHMLTNEAFNALLKTLEEPPPHVKFILATTEFHKIPTTIISRCQKYTFKPIPFVGILGRLKKITEVEGVEISDQSLAAVASVAQGSMRDAQSALDQLIAFGGKSIRDEDVQIILGVVDQKVVAGVIDAVADQDRRGLIRKLQQLNEEGISAQMVARKLVERVRHLLVCKAAGWDETLLPLPDYEGKALEEQAGRFAELDLIRFYDLLNRTAGELRYHSQPEIHLEISLLKLVEVAQLASIEEVIGELKGSGSWEPKSRVTEPDTESSRGGQKEIPPPANDRKPEVRAPEPRGQGEEEERQPIGFARESSGTEAAGPEIEALMKEMESRFVSLYQQLQFASTITYRDGELLIRFPHGDQVHASSFVDGTNRRRLSESFANIVGSQPEIKVEIEEDSKEPAQERVNPTEIPEVRSVIERFPGKVIVKKNLDQ